MSDGVVWSRLASTDHTYTHVCRTERRTDSLPRRTHTPACCLPTACTLRRIRTLLRPASCALVDDERATALPTGARTQRRTYRSTDVCLSAELLMMMRGRQEEGGRGAMAVCGVCGGGSTSLGWLLF